MDAWQILRAIGVPIGAPRPVPTAPADWPAAALALESVARRSTPLDERERTALLAWLRALLHHWPSRFETVLGEAGPPFIAALAASGYDENRYLKLRRIAIENLAGVA